MPGVPSVAFGSCHDTSSIENRLDPILESFVQRFQQIEKADQEKSSLLKVRRLFQPYAC
jgi:hypothetical protein